MRSDCRPSRLRRPPPLQNHAARFKALADPSRLEILALLSSANEPLCVCHLESHFALSQPTISHHLRVLREAGLVVAERRGTWVFYRVEANAFAFLRTVHAALSKAPAVSLPIAGTA